MFGATSDGGYQAFRGDFIVNVEKSDLKGMSAEDKVKVLFDASKDFNPDYARMSLEEALASKTGAVREAWGAV